MDAVVVRRFLLAVRGAEPLIIHGASRSKGLDAIVDAEAEALGILRSPYPVAPCDGHDRAAPIRRNVRMADTSRPHLGAAWVIGNVGEVVGTKGHYLTNGSDHMINTLLERGVAVVIYRENGVEPCRSIADARTQLEFIWRAGLFREDVAIAGKFVRRAIGAPPEALIAARSAVEALRVKRPTLAPWLEPIEAVLR